MAEKAFSLLSLKDYDSSIKTCQLAIQKESQARSLSSVYTTYSNALDASEKPQEAIEIYNQGISLFPDYYQLHFNKGITLFGLQKYEEALLCFQNSLIINPFHASSHSAIGKILISTKKNIPSRLWPMKSSNIIPFRFIFIIINNRIRTTTVDSKYNLFRGLLLPRSLRERREPKARKNASAFCWFCARDGRKIL